MSSVRLLKLNRSGERSMKFLNLFIVMLGLTACQSYVVQSVKPDVIQTTVSQKQKSNHTLIVFYNGDKKQDILALFNTLKVEVIYDYQTMNGFAIKVNPKQFNKIKQQLENAPDIYAVNEEQIMQLHGN